jgi:hypothetical protein
MHEKKKKKKPDIQLYNLKFGSNKNSCNSISNNLKNFKILKI